MSKQMENNTNVAGGFDCTTEFFNGSAWKKLSDYLPHDAVLTYNIETDMASLAVPIQYIKEPCKTMYHFETGRGVNQTFSGNQQMLMYTDGKHQDPFVISGENFAKAQNEKTFHGKIKNTFTYQCAGGILLSDLEIKVMLAAICDGTFVDQRNPESTKCCIGLKKSRKKNALYKLLREYSGDKLSIYESDNGYTYYYFNAPMRTKRFTWDWYQCSHEQLELICENVIQWDGSVSTCATNKGHVCFTTTDKDNADFIQFAFNACGIMASVLVHDRQGTTWVQNGKTYTRKSIEYTVSLSDKQYIGWNNWQNKAPVVTEVVPEDGFKYNFIIPGDALILRRNGRIFITKGSNVA